MTDYRIDEAHEEVTIRVTEASGHEQELLEAFEECRDGHCTCPTDEYQKLAEMDVATTGDEISLRLVPKAGERFDVGEIAVCPEHTTSKLQED